MPNKPTTTIRIDLEDKDKANKIFKEIGINLSSAVNAFLKVVIREGSIPFPLEASSKPKEHESRNTALNRAFMNRKDEFYTMYEDVEKEMLLHADQFVGRTVLCNCDDPFEYAFFRFFVINFNKLGLSKLISTCYSPSSLSKTINTCQNAYMAVITKVPNVFVAEDDGSLDLNILFNVEGNRLSFLAGDGDFRSSECINILKNADIVCTNPPFSLFREYISLLIEHGKHFIILGNMNAVTCKEIFPLFRDNKVWYGDSISSGDRKFFVPDDYPLEASGCGIDAEGRRYIRVKGVRWFTNLETPRRRIPLNLTNEYSPTQYPKYDNYDAIEVSKTMLIPTNYSGIMGVPITFLDKYCPEQFKILMLANGNARTNNPKDTLDFVGYEQAENDRGGVCMIDGKMTYARILIQRIDR